MYPSIYSNSNLLEKTTDAVIKAAKVGDLVLVNIFQSICRIFHTIFAYF